MEKDKIIIGRKGVDIEPGIIFAPYIPMTSDTIIHGYGTRNIRRKKKINKIFKLELDIDDGFQPSNPIMSKYSKKMINKKFYTTIEVK
jgi:hypothetical protein